MELLKAVLFGIVEGVTEWLPISSTGHLILLNEFITLNISDAFRSMFDVVIQLGAIMAVVILFWSQIWPFGKKNNKKISRCLLISILHGEEIFQRRNIRILCKR